MELGACICTSHKASCPDCPLQASCAAYRAVMEHRSAAAEGPEPSVLEYPVKVIMAPRRGSTLPVLGHHSTQLSTHAFTASFACNPQCWSQGYQVQLTGLAQPFVKLKHWTEHDAHPVSCRGPAVAAASRMVVSAACGAGARQRKPNVGMRHGLSVWWRCQGVPHQTPPACSCPSGLPRACWQVTALSPCNFISNPPNAQVWLLAPTTAAAPGPGVPVWHDRILQAARRLQRQRLPPLDIHAACILSPRCPTTIRYARMHDGQWKMSAPDLAQSPHCILGSRCFLVCSC